MPFGQIPVSFELIHEWLKLPESMEVVGALRSEFGDYDVKIMVSGKQIPQHREVGDFPRIMPIYEKDEAGETVLKEIQGLDT